jgi:hypothetical protein
MKDRLTHEETSTIVNALNYYSTWAEDLTNEDYKKQFIAKVEKVLEKFEKLEEQIMKLTIKE